MGLMFGAAGLTRAGAVVIGAIALTSPMVSPWPMASSWQIASAHQTQIRDGVGGTHHIEPNDTPRAGEPSQTWFGLTQAGGSSIGLGDCDCALTLYDAAGVAIAQPPLKAIAVEGLTDVPAAEVTFPQVGTYVLSLSGRPKGEAAFARFRLDFPVTVAAGTGTSPASATVANDLPKGAAGAETSTEADLPAEAEASNAGAKNEPRKEAQQGMNPGATVTGLLLLGGLVGFATILGWRKKTRDRSS